MIFFKITIGITVLSSPSHGSILSCGVFYSVHVTFFVPLCEQTSEVKISEKISGNSLRKNTNRLKIVCLP